MDMLICVACFFLLIYLPVDLKEWVIFTKNV